MFELNCARPWLVARFAVPQRMVSWSLNRPGFADSSAVAWLEVHDGELRDVSDVKPWFNGRLAANGLGEAVGLITARNVARFECVSHSVQGVTAQCVITLGLNNGEHVGQRIAAPPARTGTINILCAVSVPLSDAGLLEASSIATQARTVALVECGYHRPGQDKIVTGTGTDCIVLSAPAADSATDYAGMHTAIGEAVGAAAYRAAIKAATIWRDEWEAKLITAANAHISA